MSSSKSLTFECVGEPPSSRTKTPPRITGHTSHETDHSITPPLIPRSPETLLPIDGDFDLNIALPARPRKGSSGSRKNSGGSRENCQSSGLSGGDLKRRLEGISEERSEGEMEGGRERKEKGCRRCEIYEKTLGEEIGDPEVIVEVWKKWFEEGFAKGYAEGLMMEGLER